MIYAESNHPNSAKRNVLAPASRQQGASRIGGTCYSGRHMSVVILLIARQGGEVLSLHDDDGEALEALAHYVDDHWADAKLPSEAADPDPSVRIGAWFNATQALYFIAKASIDEEA